MVSSLTHICVNELTSQQYDRTQIVLHALNEGLIPLMDCNKTASILNHLRFLYEMGYVTVYANVCFYISTCTYFIGVYISSMFLNVHAWIVSVLLAMLLAVLTGADRTHSFIWCRLISTPSGRYLIHRHRICICPIFKSQTVIYNFL